MIESMSTDEVTYVPAPTMYRARTPPIVEAVGLGAAVDYMMHIGC